MSFWAKTRCERLGHFWQSDPSIFYEESDDHPGGPPGNAMLVTKYETLYRTCRCCGLKDALTVSLMEGDQK